MTELSAAAPASVAAARASGLARLRASKWLPLPVLLAGTFLIVLDFFIVNVALPSLQRDLHASSATVEWVVVGYGLTFAVFLLAAGRLGDRIGRRRVFVLGVAAFTAASLGCGIAPTAEVLVLARLVQGVAAAMISPTVLALLGTLYAGPDRSRAIGVYATVMGIAAAGGQLIGGLLLHADPAGLGWRAIFLINVPLGLLALAAVRACLPRVGARTRARVDVPGLLLATAALTALVLPLLDGRQHGWPWWSLLLLAAAPVLLAGFIRRQRRSAAPLIVPAWFGERSFRLGMLTQFGFWCGQASYFLVLALYLQFGRGLSALGSGLVFSILAVAYLGTSSRAPRLVARYGAATVVCGCLALAAGHAVEIAAVATGGRIIAMAPGLLLSGAGMGLCLAPITTIVLTTMQPERAGAISGLLSTVQQVGNAVGVAIVGVVFYGALHHGYPAAFQLADGLLAAVLAVTAGCAYRLLAPRPS